MRQGIEEILSPKQQRRSLRWEGESGYFAGPVIIPFLAWDDVFFLSPPPLLTVLHVNSQMANMLYIKLSYIQEFAYLPWQLWRGSRDKYWQDWRGGVGLNHRRIKTEEKERLSLLFGGQNRFNSLTCKQFCTKMIWRKGWINPILHIVLVQFIIVFKSSWWKITSATSNWINSAPQAAAMTFAFSCMG